MLCYLFACQLEDEMIEAGIELPAQKSILHQFPPFRLVRNITAINKYIGFDVTRHIVTERVLSPIKKDIRSGFVAVRERLVTVKTDEKSRIRSLLYVLDVGVYEFRKSFKNSISNRRKGHQHPK